MAVQTRSHHIQHFSHSKGFVEQSRGQMSTAKFRFYIFCHKKEEKHVHIQKNNLCRVGLKENTFCCLKGQLFQLSRKIFACEIPHLYCQINGGICWPQGALGPKKTTRFHKPI